MLNDGTGDARKLLEDKALDDRAAALVPALSEPGLNLVLLETSKEAFAERGAVPSINGNSMLSLERQDAMYESAPFERDPLGISLPGIGTY
mmetsp:Transcript_36732/g.67029  ORF Transcript_36732/g.67029 Transcript_36732/m.67029 type:complete len:91 (-) Transcript_36732:28-300(-)